MFVRFIGNCFVSVVCWIFDLTEMSFAMQHALTLVFVETKRGADALESWMLECGFGAVAIHGDKVQMVSLFCLHLFILHLFFWVLDISPLAMQCYNKFGVIA